jgi:hypothetical protein
MTLGGVRSELTAKPHPSSMMDTMPSDVQQAVASDQSWLVSSFRLRAPFRRLHTFRFLRPARLRTPLLGYGAPHLSARGNSTLLNNAPLSADFRIADDTARNVPGVNGT